MKTYLFVLGRNVALSRAELKNFCDEILVDEKNHLLLAENLKFENPRDLPKSPEQIFLDRLGGTIRIAEIVDEFFSKEKMADAIAKIALENGEEKPKIGVSAWGTGNRFLPDFLKLLKTKFAAVRFENVGGKNLTSGNIFDRKLLKRGNEFIVWQRENSFLLAKTCANQNLRNYVLRDRDKPFRDAKMGMLPPKLAQILINLAAPGKTETVLDPFCGSGTICSESAIAGFRSVGSDTNSNFLDGAKKNFQFLAEKFRYNQNSGTFFVREATEFPFGNYTGVIATEGWLGENFEKIPTPGQIAENEKKVVELWTKFFANLHGKNIRRIALCLPCWRTNSGEKSIAEKIFAKAKNSGYTPLALFGAQNTFVYARDESFVAREICVLEKK
ncbi:hypothetical protein HN954_00705 [bacterium]|nr:hypothetical protein [bacterium]MBT6832389.1 hypothetical protein [bacterium]MBT6995934.1 hypothetical protein [bacterium]MBT7772795.1 hypothetical protein [bacterium]